MPSWRSARSRVGDGRKAGAHRRPIRRSAGVGGESPVLIVPTREVRALALTYSPSTSSGRVRSFDHVVRAAMPFDQCGRPCPSTGSGRDLTFGQVGARPCPSTSSGRVRSFDHVVRAAMPFDQCGRRMPFDRLRARPDVRPSCEARHALRQAQGACLTFDQVAGAAMPFDWLRAGVGSSQRGGRTTTVGRHGHQIDWHRRCCQHRELRAAPPQRPAGCRRLRGHWIDRHHADAGRRGRPDRRRSSPVGPVAGRAPQRRGVRLLGRDLAAVR